MAYASIVGTWDSGTASASGTWSCEIFYPSTITYPGGSVSQSSSGTYNGSWGPISQSAGTTVSYSVSSPVANASVSITAPSGGGGGGDGGNISVPNVVGTTEDSAEGILVSAGLGVTFSQTTSGATKANHGTIKSQNPTAGSSVAPGTTVALEVYNYPNWFNLGGTLTSNDGTAPGAYPGIWYYVEARNDYTQDVQVSWSIPGTSLSGTQVIAPYNQYLWAPPSAAHLSASYATTYTLTVTASAIVGGVTINPVEIRSWQVTTPPVPVVAPSWSDNVLSSSMHVGEAYSDSVSASGTSPITYSVSSGSLPDGLSLSGGTISGTPTTKGAYSFTISATNSAGSISASFSGTVSPAKGGVYVFDGTTWVESVVKTLNGSGGSEAAEVWFYNGSSWVKSF